MLPQCCPLFALEWTFWVTHCTNVAPMVPQCGPNVAPMWHQCGPMLPQWGPNVATKSWGGAAAQIPTALMITLLRGPQKWNHQCSGNVCARMWLQCCPNVAPTLPLMLPPMLLQCCSNVAPMLPQCGPNVATMLPQCCPNVAPTLPHCCPMVAPMLLQCCPNVAPMPMLLQCCPNFAQCCPNGAPMWPDCFTNVSPKWPAIVGSFWDGGFLPEYLCLGVELLHTHCTSDIWAPAVARQPICAITSSVQCCTY